ncbi:SDR family oxidoreductase [Marivibrio halodurans]|uniref:SDR family oxidoreductase n=1 Tax=Marivibrio halodurans TaxID=2039722 RepID=A0A8J7S551_9PROT|nr:SDR family oxidoreductase [Marivibrio halodurans]MBP5858718.1 SDR family oxidoreductase [Marivibrio halodurans]
MSAPASDRVLLITGASSGIGAATARAAVADGWKVALAARSTDKLSALVDELGAERAMALACDVTNEAQVARMVQAAADFGPLAAVFANAGLGSTRAGVEDGDLDNWRTMLDVNIWGLLTVVHHALPHLRETRGHVILTGSNAGRRPIKGSIYGATKWFVNGFSQNLSAEMTEWGGRCTLLTPGMVDTPFFESPKPDALRAEDVARAVAFALAQPSHVNMDEMRVTPV